MNLEYKKFIIALVLLFQTYSYSQENNNKTILKKIHTTDSNELKSKLYLDLAKVYTNTKMDSAIYYAKKGFNISKLINNNKNQAENARFLGDCFIINNQFKDAKYFYTIAANYYKKENKQYDYCKIKMILGNVSLVQNDYIKALEIYRECLDISKKNNYTKLTAHLNNNIGSLYYEIEDYKEADKCFKNAYKLFIKLGDKQNAVYPLSNISNIQNKFGKHEEAIKNYNNIIKIISKKGNWEDLVAAYKSVAETYISMGEYDKAEEYNNLTINIINKNKNKSVNFRGPISLNISMIYYNAAFIYNEKNELDKALEYAHKSLKLSYANSYKKYIYENARILYVIFEKKNRIDSALFYNKLYIKYSDEFKTENDIKEITQLKMQYQLDDILKNKEIEDVKNQAKNKRKELIYLGISIFTILGIIIMILLFRNQKSKTAKLILNEEKLQLEKTSLTQDIEYKRKELASNMMYLLEKNEFILSIAQKLKALKPESDKGNQKILHQVIIELNQNSSNKIWEEFEIRFKEVHSTFYDSLNKLYPDLTPNEIKICAFLRLNMSTKDISSITHQSVKSINMARFRLRKKLDIESEENLISFLIQL